MRPAQEFPGATPAAGDGASSRPDQPSTVTVQVDDGAITVKVVGRVDQLAAAAFREEMLEIWSACVGILVVDLSACTYLSGGAVQALQDAWRRSPQLRGQLQVTADHPEVTAVLDSANIPRIRGSGR